MSLFSKRSTETEIMDDLNIEGEVVDQTLRELDIINKVLGGNHVTLSGIRKIVDKGNHHSRELRIVDMGCGGGEMLKKIARWARSRNLPVQLTGIDANPGIIEYAKTNTKDFDNINFKVGNVFDPEIEPDQFDIILSTLFLHHFDNRESSKLINQWTQSASLGVVINDIHRHPLAYYSIKLLTKLLSRSYMVRNDAPVSVLRAFKRSELTEILRESEVKDFSLSWHWAFRWKLLVYTSKPPIEA